MTHVRKQNIAGRVAAYDDHDGKPVRVTQDFPLPTELVGESEASLLSSLNRLCDLGEKILEQLNHITCIED